MYTDILGKYQKIHFLKRTTESYCRDGKIIDLFLIIGLVLISSIVYYYNTNDIELKIAHGGMGPHDYVAHKLHPENFRRDWPHGILNYDRSIPMRGYYYLARYLAISPTKALYFFNFIKTLLFFLSVAFLAQSLFRNKLVTLISLPIISLSNLAGLNLASVGYGYSSLLGGQLFYGYSNAFRFFALGFFLKNKYVPCFIFLAFSFYCHVSMGFFALAFIGGYLLYKPIIFRDKTFLVGILVFLVLVAPHILSIISNAPISYSSMSLDQWVKSSRIFSYHLYPITMKLFTKNADRVFFPFLLLCFFFFIAFKYQDIKNEKNIKIIMGSITCLIITTMGIYFSGVRPIPFLIKISLPRSTGLITFIGTLYLIHYLFKKAENERIIICFLAVYSCLILAFSKPGIAVLPLFALLYSDTRKGYFGWYKIPTNRIKMANAIYFSLVVLVFSLSLIAIIKGNLKTGYLYPFANNVSQHMWSPLQNFDPFNRYDYLVRGGSIKSYSFVRILTYSIIFTAIVIAIKKAQNKILHAAFLLVLVSLTAWTIWHFEGRKYRTWRYYNEKATSAYLDVQAWAKNNTPVDALFMQDPSYYYGWRDFSERSSFGNLHEWGYVSFKYNSDALVYQEGLKRMREFGIDIDRITEEDLENSEYRVYNARLTKDIRSAYYNMGSDQLQRVCNKYGIDYFVMNKKFLETSHMINLYKKFKIAYQNDYFIVFTHGT